MQLNETDETRETLATGCSFDGHSDNSSGLNIGCMRIGAVRKASTFSNCPVLKRQFQLNGSIMGQSRTQIF